MTDDLDLVRRLRDRRFPQSKGETPAKRIVSLVDSVFELRDEAALRLTALLDENAALKRDNEQHAANYREVVGLKCELQERFDQLATQFTTAEASRDMLAGKLDTIHTAAILYIGGEADVSHDAATKLIERIATIARSTEE